MTVGLITSNANPFLKAEYGDTIYNTSTWEAVAKGPGAQSQWTTN